jgi:polyketide biosynthesis enoyl-CoA hydratase PksH
VDSDCDALLRRHLLRLRPLSQTAIHRYKAYMNRIAQPLADLKSLAVASNVEVFTDPQNLQAIARYVERGLLPWEKS